MSKVGSGVSDVSAEDVPAKLTFSSSSASSSNTLAKRGSTGPVGDLVNTEFLLSVAANTEFLLSGLSSSSFICFACTTSSGYMLPILGAFGTIGGGSGFNVTEETLPGDTLPGRFPVSAVSISPGKRSSNCLQQEPCLSVSQTCSANWHGVWKRGSMAAKRDCHGIAEHTFDMSPILSAAQKLSNDVPGCAPKTKRQLPLYVELNHLFEEDRNQANWELGTWYNHVLFTKGTYLVKEKKLK